MSTFPPILIRAAMPHDIVVIAGLLTQLNRLEGNPVTTDSKKLASALFGKEQTVSMQALVAEIGREVVASVLYYPGYDVVSASYGYHLADLIVEQQYWRQGIGQKIFAQLAAQNLAEGGQWISLTVLHKNAAAQAFYKKLGMTQVEVHFFAAGPVTLSGLTHLLQK